MKGRYGRTTRDGRVNRYWQRSLRIKIITRRHWVMDWKEDLVKNRFDLEYYIPS